MELREFLEKYLPDYKQKWVVYMEKKYPSFVIYENDFIKFSIDFIIDIFPEALQNFADRICKKQRENCNDSFDRVNCDGFDEIAYSAILNAEQPKIEEI